MHTLSNEKILFLNQIAAQLRIDSIRSTSAAKSGHPTSCLSIADIIAVLFFEVMNFDKTNPKNETNDRFILSKGHAIPVVYAAWKNLGVITDATLLSLRKFDSVLEGHPTPRFPYNEAATGSLGQGLSIGLGMALSAKKNKLDYTTYVLLGDGEVAEGSVWEAAEVSSYYKTNNLIAILDVNRLGQSQETMVGDKAEIYAKKFSAFGWSTLIINGHDIEEIISAFNQAKKSKDLPTIIIAKTKKGYGVSFLEDKEDKHGKALTKEEETKAIEEIKKRFNYNPSEINNEKGEIKSQIESSSAQLIKINLSTDPNSKYFEKNTKMATRKAFGYALVALGQASKKVMVLDGDVKNSTFTEFFEKEFPERFIECFVAEQNMVGVATGLELRENIPFAATFGAFFTRAFDQIRMCGIGRNALRLCGSHCGVSIGEDGPSQMALEDIAMFRAIPNSIILYPADGISTYKLVEIMANYNDGISYLRTTRADTPNIYSYDENFSIGGCKVLKQSDSDKVCIIGAGITLHEALSAHEELKQEGINSSIIDLYSVKPLDAKIVKAIVKKSSNKILVVEDHYHAGGIGEAVASVLINEEIKFCSLSVNEIPRSGTPDQLLNFEKINAKNIVETIKKML